MNPGSRWRTLAAAVVTSVVLVAGLIGPDSTTALAAPRTDHASGAAQVAQARATTVKRVSPLNAKGHLRARYVVRSTHRGYCWTASFVNGHLYRCLTGNFLLDPCWKESGRHTVVCLVRPWSTKVVRLRLTRHLPAEQTYSPGIWGLRLGGGVGVKCLVSMGAAGAVGKHPISYVCQRGWVLLGNRPDRSRQLWTMLTAKQVGNHYVLHGRKPLRVAWKAVLR